MEEANIDAKIQLRNSADRWFRCQICDRVTLSFYDTRFFIYARLSYTSSGIFLLPSNIAFGSERWSLLCLS